MGLPDISDVCVALDAETGLDIRLGVDLSLRLDELKITMPGGLKLQAKAGTGIPNPGDLVADLLAQLNAALIPFQPIFDIIDILLLVVKVFEAVKSLNPIKIGDVLVKLIKKVDVVAAYVPFLSIPLMIRDIIDVLLVFLAGLKAALTVSLDAKLQLDASAALAADLVATGDPDALEIAASLNLAIDCGQANLDAMFSAQSNNAKPLNRFLALLSALCGVVGLPELPTLEMGGDVTVAADAVDALIIVLGTVRAAIPV